MHGRLTQLLIDFTGTIIALRTLIPGRTNDALAAIYNKFFQKIVGRNFALGHPGFQGCRYVVAGLGASQLHSTAAELFYLVSKREQRLIEHVNGFLKRCRSIDKDVAFVHNDGRLLRCDGVIFRGMIDAVIT